MTDTKLGSAPAKPRRWLRWLLGVVAGLTLLLLAAYFVVTSGAFFKGFLLPRVGKSINADVTVADASISPFSHVVLRGLEVKPKGAGTLFTAAEVRAFYSLRAILGGTIAVDEVAVVSPAVNLVRNPDGTSNLDPILNAFRTPGQPAPPPPSKPSKPLVIDIKSVTLSNGTVRQVKNEKGGGRQTVEFSGLNVSLANLKNGQTARADLSADIKFANDPPAPATNTALQARLTGIFDVTLSPELQPNAIKGNAKLAVGAATGAFNDLATLAANLDCEITPTQVQQVALKFRKGSADLGQLRVSGPFDLSKLEGRLAVEILDLDRNVLNIAGSAHGIDFGSSVLNSTNQIQITTAGKAVSVVGQLTGASLSLSQKDLTTPTLDLALRYNATVDQPKQVATIQTLTLDATRNQRPLLKGALAKPMTLAWSPGANAVEESAFNLTLSDLNLADWRGFLGTNVSSGLISAKLDLLSQKSGQQINFTGAADGSSLSAAFGSNRIDQAGFTLKLRGGLAEFQKLQLTKLDLKFSQGDQPVASAQGAGSVDLKTMDAALDFKLDAALPGLAALVNMPNFEASSGSLKFDGNLKQTNLASGAKTPSYDQAVQGNLALANFTGRYGAYRLNQIGAALVCDVGVKSQRAGIRRLNATLQQAGQPTGALDMTGDYNLTNQAANLTLKLADLNQNALRPFLADALGDKTLVSVTVNANLNGSYDPNRESALKGDLRVTNLVVKDPKGQLPATVLEAKLELDTGLRGKVADLRACSLTLTPTDRAKNQLQVTGQVDFTQTNAVTGNVKLAADSLDATRYYDILAGGSKTNAAASPASPATTSATALAPEKEPAAINLPVHNFTVAANIRSFYLRGVAITNFQTTLKIDGGDVLLKPFQLALNGAPINGNVDLNLGAPGFKYDVDFTAKAVPLAPLVDSFQPDRKGQVGGAATALVRIKGAGVTGASLQKNLTGQFDINSTNLNLSIVNVRSPILKSLVNIIVGIPDFISNPGAGLGNLLSRLTGARGQTNGWMDQLTQAPIDAISARGTAGNGRIDLQQAVVQSAAFQAGASGTVTLAPVLTNSTLQIPVTVSLNQPLAAKVGLVPAGTPTNATYVKLPDFVTLQGTVGEPKEKINYLALGSVAAKAGTGILGRTGGALGKDATGIVGTIGNLLGGGAVTNLPPAGATNQPAATTPPVIRNLLDRFKKK